MFRFVIFSLFVIYCNAGNLGYGGSIGASRGLIGGGIGISRGGYGGIGIGAGSLGGFGGGFGGGVAHSGGPIPAAVQSTYSINVVPVSLQRQIPAPQIIDIDSGELPVILNFNSRSSRIQATQNHFGSGPGEVQQTQSEEEPHRLVHEVVKPIIQEVREVITPYRQVVQEIRPVIENVQTIVAKGEGISGAAYGGGALVGAGYGGTRSLGLGLSGGSGYSSGIGYGSGYGGGIGYGGGLLGSGRVSVGGGYGGLISSGSGKYGKSYAA